jgi:predicted 3-demethylubiquinone-9 3-methyltransferase (glyoxalase superfamily)
MSDAQKIVPCLWFDGNAEDAAAFYVSLFEGSAIAQPRRPTQPISHLERDPASIRSG